MKTKTRHVQILVDEETYQMLRLRSYYDGKSVGALIREAIDKMYRKKPGEYNL